MKQLPTADKVLQKHVANRYPKDNSWKEAMIEFAKLHVQAALESAAEKAIAKENPSDYGTGEIWVDEKSILNAYPLNKIK